MVGPVLLAFGDDEQKARHLPGIRSSEVIWCQGYSEPNAGSDLASLTCRAVRDGDDYVVNGRKIWTSAAHWADWMFTLVRTSSEGKRQEGISCLLIDMNLPGITIQPIARFSGFHEFNEVILEDVRVPASERVHDENLGWTVAKYLLGHERIGSAGIGLSMQRLARLKEIAARETADGAPLTDDPRFAGKIADVEIQLMSLRLTTLRMVASASADSEIGPEASLLKIRGTEIQQELHELLMEAVGYYSQPYVERALIEGWNEDPVGPVDAAGLAPRYFDWRKASIYAGSNEIQKNIISKAVLGL
jgi:alkylation response protein AidB-like acyl-CoA dehydrogenase